MPFSHKEIEEWFQYYFSLGPDRTLKKVAEHFGVPLETIKYYSAKEGWLARCHYLEEEAKKQAQSKIEKIIAENLEKYFDNIFKINEIIRITIEEFLSERRGLPIKHTRDLKNIVEAFKAIAELEMNLKEGKQNSISILISRELAPKLENALLSHKDEEEEEEDWQSVKIQ